MTSLQTIKKNNSFLLPESPSPITQWNEPVKNNCQQQPKKERPYPHAINWKASNKKKSRFWCDLVQPQHPPFPREWHKERKESAKPWEFPPMPLIWIEADKIGSRELWEKSRKSLPRVEVSTYDLRFSWARKGPQVLSSARIPRWVRELRWSPRTPASPPTPMERGYPILDIDKTLEEKVSPVLYQRLQEVCQARSQVPVLRL